MCIGPYNSVSHIRKIFINDPTIIQVFTILISMKRGTTKYFRETHLHYRNRRRNSKRGFTGRTTEIQRKTVFLKHK